MRSLSNAAFVKCCIIQTRHSSNAAFFQTLHLSNFAFFHAQRIETNKGTQFSQVNFGRYADFSRTVSQRIHLVHSVSVIRARSNYTTVFMGEASLEYPLSTTGGIPYRFRSIWRTQDSTRELYKCYLRKTSHSIHQPSLAIDFMISYGGTHSERLTDDFGSTRNTYWEYWGISPHNIELRKHPITTSFYSLALAIFRHDCYFDSHVTFTARLSISEFKLHRLVYAKSRCTLF